VELDKSNGNTKWQDAEATEKSQLMEYNTFIDNGIGGIASNGYKKIRCHMIYDVKHDGPHKAQLVAGGHLTDPNTESVYSGVVSLHGICLIVFLAELNALELWGAEVGDLAGHTLLIFKALYGLRSSGLCWHQCFADVLPSMGFIQSKAKTDIWMRENNGFYEL
jgi:hypothetical protein